MFIQQIIDAWSNEETYKMLQQDHCDELLKVEKFKIILRTYHDETSKNIL